VVLRYVHWAWFLLKHRAFATVFLPYNCGEKISSQHGALYRCGTKEYSATRDHERQEIDDLLLSYYVRAAQILEEKGMRPQAGRLAFQVEADAGHHELAWRWRLTGALDFLLSPWWEAYA
jgi:hypothetical protein